MNQTDLIAGLEARLLDVMAERERFRQALQLIAAPKRPDGTYNRCREACEILARETLDLAK